MSIDVSNLLVDPRDYVCFIDNKRLSERNIIFPVVDYSSPEGTVSISDSSIWVAEEFKREVEITHKSL